MDEKQSDARHMLREAVDELTRAASIMKKDTPERHHVVIARGRIETALVIDFPRPPAVAPLPTEPPLTASALASALGGFWNAAIGASHRRQEGAAFAEIVAEGFAEIQRGLQDQADKYLKPEGEDRGEAN